MKIDWQCHIVVEEIMRYEELTIEGRNAVLELLESGKDINKIFINPSVGYCPQVFLKEKRRKFRRFNFTVEF